MQTWQEIVNLPSVGWASAATLALALAAYFIVGRVEDRRRRAKTIQDAERDYRLAIESRDHDRISVAAARLRDARAAASRDS